MVVVAKEAKVIHQPLSSIDSLKEYGETRRGLPCKRNAPSWLVDIFNRVYEKGRPGQMACYRDFGLL